MLLPLYLVLATANARPVETTTDHIHNHFERPLRLHYVMYLRVYVIYASLDFLLYLAKPTTSIDHSVPVEK